MQTKNRYGYSPNDLFVSGGKAVEDSLKPFGDDGMGRIERDRGLRERVLSENFKGIQTQGAQEGEGQGDDRCLGSFGLMCMSRYSLLLMKQDMYSQHQSCLKEVHI